MKNFLVSFIVAVIFILPNFAQADALEDFKNILASKHFFIKYTYQRDGDYNTPTNSTGVLVKDKSTAQIMNTQNFNAPHIAIEAYNGNNYYTEDSQIPICNLKIGDKLFMLRKIEINGKVKYRNSKTAYYQEVDEEFNFIKNTEESSIGIAMGADGSIALRPAIIALLNDEDDPYTGKFLYRRAGSGTTEDGLEYFDFKTDMRNSDYLNAIRYTFKDGVIKQITLAIYLKNQQTGEISGSKTIIDIKEFNTNPDPKYFQLPKNFKKIEKAPTVEESWQWLNK